MAKETIEEVAEKYAMNKYDNHNLHPDDHFIAGAKWQEKNTNNMANKTFGISQAFASIAVDKDRTYGDTGLTKREYFAAVALQGILAFNKDASGEEFARKSVKYADALINALNK